MSLKIYPINFGNMEFESSGLVMFRSPGTIVTIPIMGFLITGGQEPILVDSGPRSTESVEALGYPFLVTEENTIDYHLAQHGLKRSDIRHIVHTHAHLDHAGGSFNFPMSTQVSITRQEMQFMASGIMGPGMYTADDTKHFIDRLHTAGALRMFDVDGTFEEEVIPGVAVRLSGGHTPGSISVLVETDEGIANICGDIAYNLQDQIIDPMIERAAHEPNITGNRAMTTLEEKRAIKRALASSRFLLPSHDVPALVEGGKIVGLAHTAISNPAVDVTKAASYTPLVQKFDIEAYA
ncbi:N-acyl homoserine lactonase family protein [Sphingomonas sp. R86520]|jgi:N-acyl homoserine lactone hydrolase|uniref:N-acyl homoserine lactonase family protein n=1 Tax=Sphingomonas sp. R86520 TaxID=3093859 RepID=UPI0036D2CDDC